MATALGQLRLLDAFHAWARERVLDAAGRLPTEAYFRSGAIPGGAGEGSIHEMLAHIVAADRVWLARWRGAQRTLMAPASEFPDLAAVAKAWAAVEADRRQFLADLAEADLNRVFTYYRGTEDLARTNAVSETVLHLANHTTHHRADACAALTAAGSPPESVDLIDFLRAGSPGYDAASG